MPTYPDNDAVTTLVAAALFAPSPTDLLARATTLARSSTHRQLVAIASAHVAGDADRVRVLAGRPCLRSSRRRPRRLDGDGGHSVHCNHEGPVMIVSTTRRRVGVIGLAVGLLNIAACSIDASNQPPPTADTACDDARHLDVGNDRDDGNGVSAHRSCR